MKKNTLYALIAASIFTNIFFSCKKENSFTTPVVVAKNTVSAQQDKIEGGQRSASSTLGRGSLTYAACDRLVNIWDPQPVKYTLAMSSGISCRKFGIPGAGGLLDFTNVDIVTFEFSGLYLDGANTVKLYRIRRTDGKYLTFHLYLDYSNRLAPGQGEELQLWIFNDLGNNKYNIMLPTYGNICRLARTYQENTDYKIGVVPSGQASYAGTTTLYIL